MKKKFAEPNWQVDGCRMTWNFFYFLINLLILLLFLILIFNLFFLIYQMKLDQYLIFSLDPHLLAACLTLCLPMFFF